MFKGRIKWRNIKEAKRRSKFKNEVGTVKIL